MQFDDIKIEAQNILESFEGQYLTAYQICQHLEIRYPSLWAKLIADYPSADPSTPMGKNTGKHFSPASFIGNALAYHRTNGTIANLRHGYFSCDGVTFNGVEPGYTGNTVSIWAIKPA